MPRDTGLDTLLDLDGTIIDQGGGYWVKIDVRLLAQPTDPGKPYEFIDAYQLLNDFFAAVDRVLKEHKGHE